MATNTRVSIFCNCGGIWVPHFVDKKKILVCPICGKKKTPPADTSNFQIKYK